MSEDKVKLESKPCPLGCQPGDDILFAGWDRLHNLPGKFHVVRCQTCGLMRTNPRPTIDTIEFYYPDNYGPYQGTAVKMWTTERNDLSLRKRLAQKIFQFNNMRLPALKPGRMLEIGCASGMFMHQMAQKGWKVAGVELSKRAASNVHTLGYPVHTGPLETAPNPQQAYDLIVGWMVLEHLHDPILALKKLYQWTKPEGWLVLSTPNAGSLEFWLFKDAWYGLHLPAHLFHYTPKTIRILLERGGWEIRKTYHQRVLSNLISSLGYKLSDLGLKNHFTKRLIDFPENAGRKHYFLYPFAYVLAGMRQTGRMTIWAKKK